MRLFSAPKYSVSPAISGEDSVRLARSRDHLIFPVLASSAATRPALLPRPRRVRSRIVAYTVPSA